MTILDIHALVGSRVGSVSFGPLIRIEFDSGWILRSGFWGEWTGVDEARTCIDEMERRSVAQKLGVLLGGVVLAIELRESNQGLVVTFDMGVLKVGENEDYEAWTLSGPRGEKIIATPSGGGGLAIWGPRDEA